MRHCHACNRALVLWWLVGWLLLVHRAQAGGQFDAIDALAQQGVQAGDAVSVSYAIMQGKQLLHARAYGWADRESKRKAKLDTRYPLASATKPITASAILRLAEQGRLRLDDRLSQHLVELGPARDGPGAATLDQLLSHTSGLGTYARIDYGESARGSTLMDALQRFGAQVNAPERIVEYSNLGYGALGEVVSAVTGKPFERAIHQLILEPLGLREAFVEPDWPAPELLATRYDVSANRLPPLRNNTPGAGNAWSSARDLARFGAWHVGVFGDAPFLSAQTRTSMQQRANAAFQHYYGNAYYGRGWYVRAASGTSPRFVWHEGGMPGASALILLIPESQLSIAVLSNQTDANAFTQRIGHALVKAVLPAAGENAYDAASAYRPMNAESGFDGRWTGSLHIDGTAVPCTLTIAADGALELSCREGEHVRVAGKAQAMANGNSVISAMPSEFSSRDVASEDHALLLLKLVRDGEQLTGALVAYVAPERLRLLLPYRLSLRRLNEFVSETPTSPRRRRLRAGPG